MQTFNTAARSAQQRTLLVRKHTKATLIAWEGWGAAYLAKHGHPFVPPKPKVDTLHPRSQKEQEAMFKFACEVPPVPTFDTPLTGWLTPDEIPPPPDIPALTAELTGPPELVPPPRVTTPSGGDTGPDSPFFPNVPTFPIGGGPVSGTPPPIVPPIIPTPEPASFVLLGTGMVALWAMRKCQTA